MPIDQFVSRAMSLSDLVGRDRDGHRLQASIELHVLTRLLTRPPHHVLTMDKDGVPYTYTGHRSQRLPTTA